MPPMLESASISKQPPLLRNRFLQRCACYSLSSIRTSRNEWGRALRAHVFLAGFESTAGMRCNPKIYILSKSIIDGIENVFYLTYAGRTERQICDEMELQIAEMMKTGCMLFPEEEHLHENLAWLFASAICEISKLNQNILEGMADELAFVIELKKRACNSYSQPLSKIIGKLAGVKPAEQESISRAIGSIMLAVQFIDDFFDAALGDEGPNALLAMMEQEGELESFMERIGDFQRTKRKRYFVKQAAPKSYRRYAGMIEANLQEAENCGAVEVVQALRRFGFAAWAFYDFLSEGSKKKYGAASLMNDE